MATRFALDEFLPYRVAVLAGQLGRAYSQVYSERFGLSRAEWRVMAHLDRDAAVSVREIHARVDMDKSKVSRAAARLEAAGVVTKRASRGDRRLVVLALTGKGRRMMRELVPAAEAFQAGLLRRLGPDAASFLRGLDALGAASPSDPGTAARRPRDGSAPFPEKENDHG